LFRNVGNGFEEITGEPIVQANNCSYGSSFGDFDNDGDLDLLVTNGYCNSALANILYANQGDGTFEDVSNLLSFNPNFCSYGAAWGDINNDGFLDLMVANCKNSTAGIENANTLMVNQGNDNNWLKIKLSGVQSNSSAIGSKVKIKATIDGEEVWQIREIRSQSGHAGKNSLVAHFGLGNAVQVDSVVIIWPAGGTQVLENVNINQKLNIVEDISNNVSRITLSESIRIQISPNPIAPTDSSIQVLIESDIQSQNSRMMFYNSLGELLWNESISINQGSSLIAIPLSSQDLSSGIYQVVLQIGNDEIVAKVVVP